MRALSLSAATAIAVVMLSSAPARADGTPECNSGVPDASTECGVNTSVAAPVGTAVGEGAAVSSTANRGTSIGAFAGTFIEHGTAIGAFARANTPGGGSLPLVAVPDAIGGTAVGALSRTQGTDSVALGGFAVVGERGQFTAVNRGTAIGAGTLVGADGGTALGSRAQATAANAVAIGADSVADQANTVSFGTVGNERRLVNVAAGVGDTDAVNMSQLNGEAATRAAADQGLSQRIDAETAGRTVLATQIANETSARAAADLGLSQRIDVETAGRTALATQLASETSARIAGDMALSQRIDAVGGRLDQMDSRLDRMEDHVASGTAVAVAMSGGVFLPDKTFNLTANVASYDGAQAGSLQIGAMVGPNVAVNVGAATGFNKRGKTAVRAGMTIGW